MGAPSSVVLSTSDSSSRIARVFRGVGWSAQGADKAAGLIFPLLPEESSEIVRAMDVIALISKNIVEDRFCDWFVTGSEQFSGKPPAEAFKAAEWFRFEDFFAWLNS